MSEPLRFVLWPTDAQALLLRAALGEGKAARAAYADWRARIDLPSLDPASSRLMPLLYANLKKDDAPSLALLKAFYLQSWGNGRRHLEKTAGVIRVLSDAGVASVVLKGVAVGLAYYGDIALRPMSDLDIAVSPDHKAKAIEALISAGWRLKTPRESRDIGYYYSATMDDGNGAELDLHWCMLAEACNDAATRHFLSQAEPLVVDGVSTLRLDATDMLFCAVIHGMRADVMPPIRWIADAMTILRHAEIDWNSMLTFAESQNLTHRLGTGLSYLAVNFNAAIPDDILARVSGPPHTFIERLESKVYVTDEAARSQRFRTIRSLYAEYFRTHRDTPRSSFYMGLVHFFRHHFNNHPGDDAAVRIARGAVNAFAAIVPAPRWTLGLNG